MGHEGVVDFVEYGGGIAEVLASRQTYSIDGGVKKLAEKLVKIVEGALSEEIG